MIKLTFPKEYFKLFHSEGTLIDFRTIATGEEGNQLIALANHSKITDQRALDNILRVLRTPYVAMNEWTKAAGKLQITDAPFVITRNPSTNGLEHIEIIFTAKKSSQHAYECHYQFDLRQQADKTYNIELSNEMVALQINNTYFKTKFLPTAYAPFFNSDITNHTLSDFYIAAPCLSKSKKLDNYIVEFLALRNVSNQVKTLQLQATEAINVFYRHHPNYYKGFFYKLKETILDYKSSIGFSLGMLGGVSIQVILFTLTLILFGACGIVAAPTYIIGAFLITLVAALAFGGAAGAEYFRSKYKKNLFLVAEKMPRPISTAATVSNILAAHPTTPKSATAPKSIPETVQNSQTNTTDEKEFSLLAARVKEIEEPSSDQYNPGIDILLQGLLSAFMLH